MKQLKRLLLMAFALVAITSCKDDNLPQVNPPAGGFTENMNLNVSPGDDFDEYANGSWKKKHPTTAGNQVINTFNEAENTIRERVSQIIQNMHILGSLIDGVEGKVNTLIDLVLDEDKQNKQGFSPLQPLLDEIGSIQTEKEIYPLLAKLIRKGIHIYTDIEIIPDYHNNTVYVFQFMQGGLSVADRDFYLGQDNDDINNQLAFQKYIENTLRLAGKDEATAKHGAELVFDIEKRLAKAFSSNSEVKNILLSYNQKSLQDLHTLCPHFNFEAFFAQLKLPAMEKVIVGQPNALQAAAEIIHSTSLDDQKLYLQWKAIDVAAAYLSADFVKQHFHFYDCVMQGKETMDDAEERAGKLAATIFENAIGKAYIEEYFSAETKARMEEFTANLKRTFRSRIEEVDWLSQETKEKALEKLDAMVFKIGYHDKWVDYSALEIADDSQWANVVRFEEWKNDYMIETFDKPADNAEQEENPLQVNAFYDYNFNQIYLLAGILNPPFYEKEFDDANLYGRIGVVIGHEMTHGFDNQGRLFDKTGNMNDWWTIADAAEYGKRTQILVDHFNGIEVAPGVKANGSFTLGENIADLGGLQIAYQAFKATIANRPQNWVENFSPEQRFFIANANLWAENVTPEKAIELTKTDEHSLGRWRVNGTLPHINAWYDAFNVNESNKRYLPKEKRAAIW